MEKRNKINIKIMVPQDLSQSYKKKITKSNPPLFRFLTLILIERCKGGQVDIDTMSSPPIPDGLQKYLVQGYCRLHIGSQSKTPYSQKREKR